MEDRWFLFYHSKLHIILRTFKLLSYLINFHPYFINEIFFHRVDILLYIDPMEENQ